MSAPPSKPIEPGKKSERPLACELVTSHREFPEGEIPLLSIEGTVSEAGRMLGFAWQEALQLHAQRIPAGHRPWWKQGGLRKVIRRYAPHLPELYAGMARGAKVDEDKISDQLPANWDPGCTAFALHPSVTLDRVPISGQTKDTAAQQQFRFVVLRLKLAGAPALLTLTYPGLLFGHGFVAGGCSIFRNSMYAGQYAGKLPFFVWGLLANHCRTVEDVVELTRSWGPREALHCGVADEHGGIIGVEGGRGGIGFLKASGGIYTHGNAVCTSQRLRRHQTIDPQNSYDRQNRLRALLEGESGRLTAQQCFYALADHDNAPNNICRHDLVRDGMTTSAVVVEPTKGLLHASRGCPCRNWPRTYAP